MPSTECSGVDKVAREWTCDLDRLRQQYAGRPLDDIKPAPQRFFARYDGNITDPKSSKWAQLISVGTRIELSPTRSVGNVRPAGVRSTSVWRTYASDLHKECNR